MPKQHGKYSRHAEQQRKGEKIPLLAQKVYVWISKKFHAVVQPLYRSLAPWSTAALSAPRRPSDAQRLSTLLAAQNPVKNHAGNKHRGEQVGQQAKGQSDRETLHWTGAKQKQDGRGHDGGDVRIHDRDPGMR